MNTPGLRYLPDVSSLKLDKDKCIGCELCATVCPHRVFVIEEKIAQIEDLDACMECGACALNCPTEAIQVEAGVGCASAIIKGWLTGSEPSCDCSDDSTCC